MAKLFAWFTPRLGAHVGLPPEDNGRNWNYALVDDDGTPILLGTVSDAQVTRESPENHKTPGSIATEGPTDIALERIRRLIWRQR
jgi:hypothetical protein